uniref:Ubiquitin carboxyl-terminal hydrolase n=1 Tax=Chinchilla lanigera TaxID=34839 RepID=A0A8C2W5Z1_CHILA
MSAIMIRGYAQIWNKRTGMSKAQGALIETVEGKKNFKLLIYFKCGKVRTFYLNNNIKSVAITSYGENLNHLHLTFQNNNFLFVERLTSADAEQLKMFLDKVPQSSPEPHMNPKRVSMSTRTAMQTKQTSLSSVYLESGEQCSGTDKEGGTSVPQNTTLLSSKVSLTSKESETQHRKKMQFSDSEVKKSEKHLIKKSSIRKRFRANPLKYKNRSWNKLSRTEVLKKSKKLTRASTARSFDSRPLGDTGLQYLPEKTLEQLLQALNRSEGGQVPKSLSKAHSQSVWQGLPNLGNTCYINAVIQSLCSIPLFVNDVLNQGFPWGRISHDIFCLCVALLLVMKDVFNMKIKAKLLVNIQKAISLVAEIFAVDTQNDAHEFLSFCLQQMKEGLQRSNVVCITENKPEQENLPQQVFAGDSAAKVPDCPVMTNFESELLRSIFCKACGQAVYKREPSNYLSISLPQGKKACPLSIQSTLDQFFITEELEYKCEKCKHKKADAVHKFSRLPRVLIIHLKRYYFNEYFLVKKNDQAVTISTYLDLSPHCNEGTKPPVPLSKNAHIRDVQLLKTFQKLSFRILCSLSLVTLESFKDSTAKGVKSGKEPASRKPQRVLRGKKRVQPQKDLGKVCKLDMKESKSVHVGDGALIGKEQLASSAMNLGDTSLPLLHKLAPQPVSSPDTCLTEAQFPEIPENVEVKKSQKTSTSAESDFDGVSETTEDFSKDNKTRVRERSQKVAKQSEESDGTRTHKDAPQRTLPESLLKLGNLQPRVSLTRCTELILQEASRRSKDSSDKKTESKTQEPEKKADEKSPCTYRLIGIISHIGRSPGSGHYISDAYDFKNQVWFTYNDLVVSSVSESVVQDSRLDTGYIFFYMHNEIFEELLLRV